MGQIGCDLEHRVVGDSYELEDLKDGYFAIKGPDGYLTVNEGGVVKWEPFHTAPEHQAHQRFSISGGIATCWPTGEKNVQIPISVRP